MKKLFKMVRSEEVVQKGSSGKVSGMGSSGEVAQKG